MLIMSVTWVQLVCLSVFILFHYFRLPKVTDEDIVQLQQAKGTPLQYIVSPDRPTVDSPFGQVQLGSILSYQVQLFNMICLCKKEIIMFISQVYNFQFQAEYHKLITVPSTCCFYAQIKKLSFFSEYQSYRAVNV